MVSLTNLTTGDTLPFRLYLLRGQWTKNYIDVLTTSTTEIQDIVYPVTELVKLGMGIETNGEQVEVKWSVMSNAEKDEFIPFSLSEDKTFHEIHPGGAPYFWSVGTYHFEVIHEGKSYFAAFQVKPINLEEDELEMMNELLEEKLKGLIVDYLKYKKTWGSMDDIKETAFWYLWEKYQKTERPFLNHLLMIEHHSTQGVSKQYKVQSVPRRMDRKSLQWELTAKGLANKEAKFYNRTIHFVEDSEENRNAKRFATAILAHLLDMRAFLQDFVKNTQHKQQQLQEALVNNEARFAELLRSRNISEGTRKKYRNKIKLNKDNLIKFKKQYTKYQQMTQQINFCIKSLESVLNNQFWSGISSRRAQRNSLGAHPAYNGVYQMYKEFERALQDEGQTELRLPVYKRTEELYEYFTFFSVIDAFLAQGFVAHETNLTDQLKSSFIHEGLSDGTTVKLAFENYIIQVVFNEELDFEHEAREKKQMMFTLKPNRKPDLRVDFFIQQEEELQYQSSVALDAKYSPLENIYSDRQVTSVMEQLDNYSGISRFNYNGDVLDSLKPYFRHPVKEVICLYAGKKPAKQEGNCIISSCGRFVRLAPTKEGTVYGQSDLTRILFNEWLGQHDEIFLL
ncbi:hypothetical protein PVA17_21535 [Lysinibacillus sp. CNPSo 3705]|uniref:hypothetical protein n=1 Tax=Lysinibacillus sp. CNPSo 3705 TaxID=3028148 RepID=UPI002363D1CA|nr:hypothetical protein [Lysinibacillus sp. CNPSo 3705]MDD1505306.1 hypothetical protein [Lysinibacillus sp. CNPSo 3705]